MCCIRRSILATTLFVAAFVALSVSPVKAQTTTPAVLTNQPFRVQATHDGVNTTHYRLYVDGAQFGSDAPIGAVRSGDTVTLSHPGLSSRGPHTVAIAALNPDNPESRSETLTFNVNMPPPSAPGLPTVVAVTTTVQLQVTPQSDGSMAVAVLNVGAVVTPATPVSTAPSPTPN